MQQASLIETLLPVMAHESQREVEVRAAHFMIETVMGPDPRISSAGHGLGFQGVQRPFDVAGGAPGSRVPLPPVFNLPPPPSLPDFPGWGDPNLGPPVIEVPPIPGTPEPPPSEGSDGDGGGGGGGNGGGGGDIVIIIIEPPVEASSSSTSTSSSGSSSSSSSASPSSGSSFSLSV
jgi:hypothetical protein